MSSVSIAKRTKSLLAIPLCVGISALANDLNAKETGKTAHALITESRWTLGGSTSCGIGELDTHYQRFLSHEYYNVIAGREYKSDETDLEYFRVDEDNRSFEASYIIYSRRITDHPTGILRFKGKLLPDGSMQVSQTRKVIDFNTLSAAVPRYNENTEPTRVVYRCDNLPTSAVGSSNASRTFIQVPDGLDFSDLGTCASVKNASFEGFPSAMFFIWMLVDGQWSGESKYTRHCVNNTPDACPLFEFSFNDILQVSSDPLTIETEARGCVNSWVFNFEGERAVVDVAGRGTNCGDPFSLVVLECSGELN